jgi:large subunit ribosomal protein L24
MKIKVGDEVVVLLGRDKEKKGKVERIFAKKNQVLVSGVNIYKKHVKKRGRVPGGIIEVTKPLPTSKVTIVCPKCELPTRLGISVQDNKKIRTCKKCKQPI